MSYPVFCLKYMEEKVWKLPRKDTNWLNYEIIYIKIKLNKKLSYNGEVL